MQSGWAGRDGAPPEGAQAPLGTAFRASGIRLAGILNKCRAAGQRFFAGRSPMTPDRVGMKFPIWNAGDLYYS